MAPGLVFLAHILVLAFPSPVCQGAACLAVESMWVTVCTPTGLVCIQRPPGGGAPSSEFTCTLIASPIHGPKYLEPSKAGPWEHTACTCLV